jgi:glycosyltransferase involved in cell wall biosynthesis
MLVILSDVTYSPQLISILEELQCQQVNLRVVFLSSGKSVVLNELINLGLQPLILEPKSKLSSLQYLFTIIFAITRFKPRIVLTSGLFATVLGMISARAAFVRRRVFIRHHSNYHHKYRLRLGQILDRVVNTIATDIIAVSPIVKNTLIHTESVNSQKVIVIPNGIDLKKFEEVSNQGSNYKDSDKSIGEIFKIGIVSRLTHWKGVEYAAAAFVKLQENHPHSHLHIIGAFSDSYQRVLEILAPLKSDKYMIEEFNPSIPTFMQQLDVFIHVPIGADEEAFGLVYIEAIASRVSCIFTLSGVLHELPYPRNYFEIVDYKEIDAIYNALVKRISAGNQEKMGIPKSWLDQFSLEKMAKSYSDLIIKGNPNFV